MGLGDAVSQILAKDVAAPDPVLAKRKTALMKELEVDQKQEQKKKKRRKEEAAAKQPARRRAARGRQRREGEAAPQDGDARGRGALQRRREAPAPGRLPGPMTGASRRALQSSTRERGRSFNTPTPLTNTTQKTDIMRPSSALLYDALPPAR